MNLYKYGEEFRKIRCSKNISQQQLADLAMCSRKYISLIETGNVAPSSTMLVRISNILGNSIIDLLKYCNCNETYFTTETKKQIEVLKSSCNYKDLNNLLSTIEQHEDYQDNQNKQYILWHKAICEMELNHNFFKAINLIKQSLSVEKYDDLFIYINKPELNMQEISIYNSLAILLNYMNANNYSIRILESLIGCNYANFPDSIKVKIYNNLASNYLSMNKYANALNTINKAISLNQIYKNPSLIGILYYNKAQILSKCKQIEKSTEFFVMTYYHYKNSKNALYMNKVIESANKCSINIKPYII
ncbi:helix-turn-helix domain-containing protein [Vallitalea maricola]|uniref:Uncharacterized protein n=1 Tax=Vallitalea maricola TaxID=3074433 RepID=A0ACB5UMY8_9FIRM|nr:hypothetical protein AN2V17_31450 [Vallitalea sp. AN17-2]